MFLLYWNLCLFVRERRHVANLFNPWLSHLIHPTQPSSSAQLWVSHFRSTKFRCMSKQSYCFCFILHNSHSSVSNTSHRPQTIDSLHDPSCLMTYLKATIGSVMAVTKNQAKCLLTLLTGKCRAKTWNLAACAVYGSDLSFGPLISIWPRLLKAYNGSRIKRAYSDRMHRMIEVASTLLGQLHFCRLFQVSFAQVQRLCISLMRCPLCVADWLLHVLASFH